MLQVIISPAKQMRAARDAFEVLGIPPFARETARLHRALLDIERNEGSDSLQALWNVSDKLLGPCLNTLHEFGPILKNGDLAADLGNTVCAPRAPCSGIECRGRT